MSEIPEPEGTRMQAVKGFSWFNYSFVEPKIPALYTPEEGLQREYLEKHFPRWYSGHWTALYNHEDGRRCLAFSFWPDGHYLLLLHRTSGVVDGLSSEASGPFTLAEEEPVYNFFRQLAERHGTDIIAHLARETRIS